MNDEGWDWGNIAAGGTPAMPVLLFSILVRRSVVHGLTTGALKGLGALPASGSSNLDPERSPRPPKSQPL